MEYLPQAFAPGTQELATTWFEKCLESFLEHSSELGVEPDYRVLLISLMSSSLYMHQMYCEKKNLPMLTVENWDKVTLAVEQSVNNWFAAQKVAGNG